MSNLNNLRKKISDAIKNNEATITFGIEEAKLFIREAESMHGGSCENTELKYRISRLKDRNDSLQRKLDAVQPAKDKVAALLPATSN